MMLLSKKTRVVGNCSVVSVFGLLTVLFCRSGLAQDLTTAPTEQVQTYPFKFSTGFDYSSGDYGDVQDTDIWYVPFTFQYEWFPLTAKVTVPYLRITGPGGVVGGGDDVTVVTSTASTTRTTESGLGDVVASLTYAIDPWTPAAPLIDFTFKVKFPTADEDDGLGTGEFDYTLQVDLAKTFGPFTPLATAGHKFKGDPSGFDLNDVWFASIGGAFKFNDHYSAGLLFDWQEPTSEFSDEAQELFGYLSWKLDRQWTLIGYGVAGFKDGSPDEGVGVQISYRPNLPW